MMMKRALCAVSLGVFLCTNPLSAQQQTGEIFGRVTDDSGAVLPGVTVTVAGPTLLQPRVVTSSASGSYRVPGLPIGTYSITFELAGFRTRVQQDIRITIGFNAQVNGQLELSSVEETVTVSGEAPIVDTRETGTKSTFDLETLQSLPSARDPWVMLERAPGITMDRVNVGGSQSGQQSGYISRGADSTNTKWSVDGVDITDMSATGASPMYYDFDMLEQMQVRTGGADVTQQTGGVGINLVTRSGTDQFRGSGRYYVTDEQFQADNINDEIRAAGAGSGAPIQNIKDYGFELGGPLKRGRAWFWGSYGTQDIKTGVVGFYKDTPTCRPTPPTDTEGLRDCLETDRTELNNYNWKVQVAPFDGNRITFQNTWAEKIRNARDAADNRPIETTRRQKPVSDAFGTSGWLTGPNPFWKASDQHVFSDRWLLDVQWAHLGNNFVLDFHEDSLRGVQPAYEISTDSWSRSFQQSIFLRPTNSVDVLSNYFLPGFWGGDHAFKVGYRWRSAHETTLNHRGGNTYARFDDGVPDSGQLYRDQNSLSHLDTHAVYAQDTYTRDRLTVNLGVRWDRQDEFAAPSTVPAHPFAPEALPAVSFPGIDAGVVWNDVSPRLGMTYDLLGDGRSIVSASYAVYFGQMSPGQLSNDLAATGAIFVRYPWDDLNDDRFVQANELDFTEILSRSSAYDPANPGNFLSPGTVDPNVENDRTRELIVGFDRQFGGSLAIGASYIWRKYDRFNWEDTVGLTSEDYVPVSFTPEDCRAGARCDTVTYFEPTFEIPSAFIRTNVPDRWRDYNGVELTLEKRYSDRWSASASYAYNNAVDTWDSPAAYEDPTCRQNLCPGSQQYAPEAGGSGIDNIYPNAKWLVKVSGRYTLPYDINLAGFYNARQGYPFPQAVRTPNRANQAGTEDVLLGRMGEARLDTLQTLDIRVDKTFRLGAAQLRPSMDIFNVGNVNTILARRTLQGASNANDISGIVAPRVVRFGLSVEW